MLLCLRLLLLVLLHDMLMLHLRLLELLVSQLSCAGTGGGVGGIGVSCRVVRVLRIA
jgi:hypothetical protein